MKISKSDSQKRTASERKSVFISMKGGQCEHCKYKRHKNALVFRHKDDQTKSFPIDSRNLANKTVDSLIEELAKCELVCLNCKAELDSKSQRRDSNPDLGLI